MDVCLEGRKRRRTSTRPIRHRGNSPSKGRRVERQFRRRPCIRRGRRPGRPKKNRGLSYCPSKAKSCCLTSLLRHELFQRMEELRGGPSFLHYCGICIHSAPVSGCITRLCGTGLDLPMFWQGRVARLRHSARCRMRQLIQWSFSVRLIQPSNKT